MMFFRKKKSEPPMDCRVWNEDWQVGDIAECVVEYKDFCQIIPPWQRPRKGQQLTVSGFSEGFGEGVNATFYFLKFSDWPIELPTQAFRKVRPVEQKQETSISEKILTSKPAPDIVRKKPVKVD